MGQTVSASVEINAAPEHVWGIVTDVTRMPEFSPELRAVRWVSTVAEPKVGARFTGSNRHGAARWSTLCEVVTADAPSRFAYRVTYLGLRISEWVYEIEPAAGGCRLTESTTDLRNRFVRYTTGPATGVLDRASHNLAGIRATLAAIKATAERESITAQ